MTPRLPSQRGLSTPDALRRLSAVLPIFECVQMPSETMKWAAKPSPNSSFRASQKRKLTHANCTFLPPARALITSGEKRGVKWCHDTSAALNDAVHQCLTPANAPECAPVALVASPRGDTALNAECPDNFTSGEISLYTFQPRHLVKFGRLWKPPDDSRNHTQAGSPS